MAQRVPVLETSVDELVQAYERGGPFPISEVDYVRIALENPGTAWELHGGLLVEKPGMSFAHINVVALLVRRLNQQLDEDEYTVLSDAGRVRRSARNYLIPDISVVPARLLARYVQEQPRQLGVFNEPLPLVVEAWSPSTGTYDVNTKIPVYKRRGDLEIWRLHPFERTLTVWRRRPNGTYDETVYHGGLVRPSSLPGVVINLDELFV
ncbi:MAG TPA: Uma2 family endonuclease [Thermomicrobiales bacterium]|jgi:Uma2 family endonuclease